LAQLTKNVSRAALFERLHLNVGTKRRTSSHPFCLLSTDLVVSEGLLGKNLPSIALQDPLTAPKIEEQHHWTLRTNSCI
jgi:hypothetical protein